MNTHLKMHDRGVCPIVQRNTDNRNYWDGEDTYIQTQEEFFCESVENGWQFQMRILKELIQISDIFALQMRESKTLEEK